MCDLGHGHIQWCSFKSQHSFTSVDAIQIHSTYIIQLMLCGTEAAHIHKKIRGRRQPIHIYVTISQRQIDDMLTILFYSEEMMRCDDKNTKWQLNRKVKVLRDCGESIGYMPEIKITFSRLYDFQFIEYVSFLFVILLIRTIEHRSFMDLWEW